MSVREATLALERRRARRRAPPPPPPPSSSEEEEDLSSRSAGAAAALAEVNEGQWHRHGLSSSAAASADMRNRTSSRRKGVGSGSRKTLGRMYRWDDALVCRAHPLSLLNLNLFQGIEKPVAL